MLLSKEWVEGEILFMGSKPIWCVCTNPKEKKLINISCLHRRNSLQMLEDMMLYGCSGVLGISQTMTLYHSLTELR